MSDHKMTPEIIVTAKLHQDIWMQISPLYAQYFDSVVNLGLHPLAAMPASIECMATNLAQHISPALVASLLRRAADSIDGEFLTNADAAASMAPLAAIYTAIEILATPGAGTA